MPEATLEIHRAVLHAESTFRPRVGPPAHHSWLIHEVVPHHHIGTGVGEGTDAGDRLLQIWFEQQRDYVCDETDWSALSEGKRIVVVTARAEHVGRPSLEHLIFAEALLTGKGATLAVSDVIQPSAVMCHLPGG